MSNEKINRELIPKKNTGVKSCIIRNTCVDDNDKSPVNDTLLTIEMFLG